MQLEWASLLLSLSKLDPKLVNLLALMLLPFQNQVNPLNQLHLPKAQLASTNKTFIIQDYAMELRLGKLLGKLNLHLDNLHSDLLDLLWGTNKLVDLMEPSGEKPGPVLFELRLMPLLILLPILLLVKWRSPMTHNLRLKIQLLSHHLTRSPFFFESHTQFTKLIELIESEIQSW